MLWANGFLGFLVSAFFNLNKSVERQKGAARVGAHFGDATDAFRFNQLLIG